MCGILGVSKQAYYKHHNIASSRLAKRAFVVEFIKSVRQKDPKIGGNKLWMMYKQTFGKQLRVGCNQFYDIIDEFRLKVRRIRHRVKTTDSKHDFPLYPNLTKDLIPNRPGQLVVSDITYIPMSGSNQKGRKDFCYLSLITDYYTKEIVGYCVAPTLETVYSVMALKMMLKRYRGMDLIQLIHHSDRGCQYAGYAYTHLLKQHGIAISMTENDNPKDNAVAERINNTIKNELLYGIEMADIKSVRLAVRLAVEFYNTERPRLSLDGLTPREAAERTGPLRKRWKSYREQAIKAKEEENKLTKQ